MMHPDLYGVRTLIFDMDGTLTASERTALASLRGGLARFYGKLGKPAPEYTDAELIAGIGAPSDDFYRSLLREEDRRRMEEFRTLIHEGELGYLDNHRVTFPGTHKTLETLRKRGYKLAVVSNCHTPYLRSVMTTQNLARHFEIMSCIGDFSGATKEKLVEAAAKQLGGKAAVIGDRYYDIDAAIANGLPSVGALYGYGNRKELENSSTWVNDIRSLLDLFYPLREAAARVASRVNELRSIDRPVTVFVSAPNPSLNEEFSSHLITELTLLNAPVSRVQLPESPDGKVLSWLGEEVLTAARNGRVDTTLPFESGKPLRARVGFAVLIDGKPGQAGGVAGVADLTVEITMDSEVGNTAAEFVLDGRHLQRGNFLKTL